MKEDISNNTFLDYGIFFNDFLIIYKRFLFGRLGKSFSFVKVFYILLQLTHSLLQLFQNADSLKDMFRESIKTDVALSKFIFEAWRFYCAPPNFALSNK